MWQLQGPSQIIIGDETLVVHRNTIDGVPDVTYFDGKPTLSGNYGAQDVFTIQCNVQPVDGRDLLIVPEADRFDERYWVYTNEKDKPVLINDRVVRWDFTEEKTVNFQVQKVETWGKPPNGYQRIMIVRDDVGTFKTP